MFGDAAAVPAVLPDDDPYGSKHVGVKSATNVIACNIQVVVN